jgi:hypothetical protein
VTAPCQIGGQIGGQIGVHKVVLDADGSSGATVVSKTTNELLLMGLFYFPDFLRDF